MNSINICPKCGARIWSWDSVKILEVNGNEVKFLSFGVCGHAWSHKEIITEEEANLD